MKLAIKYVLLLCAIIAESSCAKQYIYVNSCPLNICNEKPNLVSEFEDGYYCYKAQYDECAR